MKTTIWVIAAIVLLTTGVSANADVPSDPYPLDTCPVTGYPLGMMGEPHLLNVEGREIAVCCEVCSLEIELHPERFINKVDQSIADQQREVYPLDTCVVADVPLDAPVEFIYKNRLYQVHSDACMKKFLDKPEPYVGKHESAVRSTHTAPHRIEGLYTRTADKAESAEHLKDVVIGQHLVSLSETQETRLRSRPWKFLNTLYAAHDVSADAD